MARSTANVAINPAALRHIRRLSGVGVSALAGEVGVTPSYISNIEAGRRPLVSPEVFRALCAALRIDDIRVLMSTPGYQAAA